MYAAYGSMRLGLIECANSQEIGYRRDVTGKNAIRHHCRHTAAKRCIDWGKGRRWRQMAQIRRLGGKQQFDCQDRLSDFYRPSGATRSAWQHQHPGYIVPLRHPSRHPGRVPPQLLQNAEGILSAKRQLGDHATELRRGYTNARRGQHERRPVVHVFRTEQ